MMKKRVILGLFAIGASIAIAAPASASPQGEDAQRFCNLISWNPTPEGVFMAVQELDTWGWGDDAAKIGSLGVNVYCPEFKGLLYETYGIVTGQPQRAPLKKLV